MRRIIIHDESGFTAVELLITLFIASMFLFAGYQLYTQVLEDGTEADKTARLSNEAYKRLRETAAKTANTNAGGCTSSSVTSSSQTIDGVKYDTVVSCPYGAATSTDIFLITITASYTDNGNTRTITHAIYTN